MDRRAARHREPDGVAEGPHPVTDALSDGWPVRPPAPQPLLSDAYGPIVSEVIRDIAELRERGQVHRRIDQLDVDVDTWRAGMRRSARREGIRIRTFIVEQADHERDDRSPRSDLVFAVRTDLPLPDPTEVAAIVDSIPAPRVRRDAATNNLASVTSLTDEQARRSGHPCIDNTP